MVLTGICRPCDTSFLIGTMDRHSKWWNWYSLGHSWGNVNRRCKRVRVRFNVNFHFGNASASHKKQKQRQMLSRNQGSLSQRMARKRHCRVKQCKKQYFWTIAEYLCLHLTAYHWYKSNFSNHLKKWQTYELFGIKTLPWMLSIKQLQALLKTLMSLHFALSSVMIHLGENIR